MVGIWNFNVWYCWEYTDRVKGSVQDQTVSVPNCPTEIPHGISWDRSRTFIVRGLRLTSWAMARHWILWKCLLQEDWRNVHLYSHSTTNEKDQSLNRSAKTETFPIKILDDFYFFDIAQYECDKKNCISLAIFEKSVGIKKITFVIMKYYIFLNLSIHWLFVRNVPSYGFLTTKYFVSKNSIYSLLNLLSLFGFL